MPRSSWLLIAAVLAACALILGSRSCDGNSALNPVAGTPDAPRRSPTTGEPQPAPADAAAGAARGNETHPAVTTLHHYIGVLPGSDRAKADAFWVGARPPAQTGEADLRTLLSPRRMRLKTWPPTPAATDDAVEIPIALHVSMDDASVRNYRGWYRLRRAIGADRWEITAASVDLQPASE